jgi:hypothetical protein
MSDAREGDVFYPCIADLCDRLDELLARLAAQPTEKRP